MATKSQRDYEKEVRSWGFSHVFTWSDSPQAHYSPHSHRGLTTHLILKGQLTITYPKDKDSQKTTYGVGDRIDVDAGKIHEVWIGNEGCTYVIGE
ncbi:RmlC-like cupin [Glarea lozoyensis ATCC 20868]|uniref:RmlC-like cupin n=1 Tax=Glarea lozoyensis (strain ATCC 20868 / MF5171) TaxID=1116229 RepID=S3DSL5_GLAL2|nr:RmlC-like cupin [Glarea lozoyensis ATCC 20868]EPE29418.1 RmlC-like cupin [Glarea lozoyensis ATCC 20868]